MISQRKKTSLHVISSSRKGIQHIGFFLALLAMILMPCLAMAQTKTIKIGSIQPVTGPLSVLGQGQRLANQLAVDHINARGGIKSMGGAKIELLLGDSESKPEIGRQEADRLIKEGAVMLVGPFQSGVAMAIATLAEQRQVPFVMDVAALDAITQKGYKHVFRIFSTAKKIVGGAIPFYKTVTEGSGQIPLRAVVTNTADPFGKGLSGGFIKFMEHAGLPVKIVARVQYPMGIQDLSAEVAKIKAAKPDILFPISRPGDSIILARELYKQRVKLMGIFVPGAPGWYEPESIKGMKKLALYAMTNAPWINPESSVYQQANASYQKEQGKFMDANSAHAYTAILVMADALERAASTSKNKILTALQQTHFKDHPLVGGAIQFDEKGDNIGARTALIQVQPDTDPQKQVKVVLPKEFAESDRIVFPAPQLWKR